VGQYLLKEICANDFPLYTIIAFIANDLLARSLSQSKRNRTSVPPPFVSKSSSKFFPTHGYQPISINTILISIQISKHFYFLKTGSLQYVFHFLTRV